LLDAIRDESAELAWELKTCVFGNIVILDDESVRAVLHETDVLDLSMALRDPEIDTDVQEKVFRNISKRDLVILKENMRIIMPLWLWDTKKAQWKIISLIRRMEESDEIVIGHSTADAWTQGEKLPDLPKENVDDILVEILWNVDFVTEKQIMESLKTEAPELAERLRPGLFNFEDVVLVSDNDLEKTLREVEPDVLALALKDAHPEVQEKIFKNRAADMVKEKVEAPGAICTGDVKKAREKIVSTIRQLDDKGEIFVVSPGESKLIV